MPRFRVEMGLPIDIIVEAADAETAAKSAANGDYDTVFALVEAARNSWVSARVWPANVTLVKVIRPWDEIAHGGLVEGVTEV